MENEIKIESPTRAEYTKQNVTTKDMTESANKLSLAKKEKAAAIDGDTKAMLALARQRFVEGTVIKLGLMNTEEAQSMVSFIDKSDLAIDEIDEAKSVPMNREIFHKIMQEIPSNLNKDFVQDMFIKIIKSSSNSDSVDKVRLRFVSMASDLSREEAEFLKAAFYNEKANSVNSYVDLITVTLAVTFSDINKTYKTITYEPNAFGFESGEEIVKINEITLDALIAANIVVNEGQTRSRPESSVVSTEYIAKFRDKLDETFQITKRIAEINEHYSTEREEQTKDGIERFKHASLIAWPRPMHLTKLGKEFLDVVLVKR